MRVNGQPATIIGVMPEGMKFPEDTEVWTPFSPSEADQQRDTPCAARVWPAARGADHRRRRPR